MNFKNVEFIMFPKYLWLVGSIKLVSSVFGLWMSLESLLSYIVQPQSLRPFSSMAMVATVPFVLGLLGGGLTLLKKRFKLAFIGSIASVCGWLYILIGGFQDSWQFVMEQDIFQASVIYEVLVFLGALVVASIVNIIVVYKSKSVFNR